MTEIQKLPEWATLPDVQGRRAETGPMQFGNDWPGVFIRGDNALHYAMVLTEVLETLKHNNLAEKYWLAMKGLEGIVHDLMTCSVGDTGWPPVIPPAQEEKS